MKILLHLLFCIPVLAMAAPGDPLFGAPDDMKIEYQGNGTSWKESAITIPAYPRDANLLPIDVSSATSNSFRIDTASLSVGKDDVVRYTVVIESPRGARTVNYEGLHCETSEFKIYAFGQPDGTWNENKYPSWENVKRRSLLSYRKALYEQYFCPDGVQIRNVETGIRNLKQGQASGF